MMTKQSSKQLPEVAKLVVAAAIVTGLFMIVLYGFAKWLNDGWDSDAETQGVIVRCVDSHDYVCVSENGNWMGNGPKLLNFQDWDDSSTPLIRAVQLNDARMVKLLLRLGADVHGKNGAGKTAWDVAKAMDRKELMPLLTIASPKRENDRRSKE